jgi:arylsulfatase A-like enzyme
MSLKPLSRAQWLVCAILAGFLLWVLFAALAIPRIVQHAYEGTRIPILSGMIEGRDVHGVEHYQQLARRGAIRLTGILAILTVVALAAIRFRVGLRSRIATLLRTPPVARIPELLGLGAWFGFLSGMIESVPMWVRAIVTHDPREAPAAEVIWMGPIAAMMAGVVVALVLALVLRAWRGLSLRVPVTLFAGAAAYAVIRNARLGIETWAATLLALGLGLQVAIWISRHPEPWRGFVRRTAPAMLVLLVLGVASTVGLDRVRERLRLARLGEATPGSPNVLFLILDTVRASELSLYGYSRETSPQLERLAAQGVTFDAAIATAPWTLPSHASLFTGRFAQELSADFDQALGDEFPTLAEVLAAHGYATGGFVANLVYTPTSSGLDRGFSAYRDHPVTISTLLSSSRWTRAPAEWIRPRIGMHHGMRRKNAAQVNDEFLGWLRKTGERPFFAFLNYFDAHHPYEVQPGFERRFSEQPPRFWEIEGWRRDIDAAERQEMVDAYDSSIAYIDFHIGKLLTALDSRGLLDNTLVVVVGDHGEHFGEHGIYIHGNSVYLPLLRVPLLVSLPGRVQQGTRVTSTVSIRDIPATVLELLGLSAASPLGGQSLSPLWQPGTQGEDRAAPSLLMPNVLAHPRDPTHRGVMQSVIRGNLHYIVNGDGVEELYNWRQDPEEAANLAGAPEARAQMEQMRRLLDEVPAKPGPEAISGCVSPGSRDLCRNAGEGRAQRSERGAVGERKDVVRFGGIAGNIK